MGDKKILNADYFCTWTVQGYASEKSKNTNQALAFMGDQGNSFSTRDAINEETVFGEDGWINYYPEVRKDLYFLIDDGWDVDYNIKTPEDFGKFGSHDLNETRFPSFKGKPEEKLKQFVERVKAKGWKGLGIWVPAQKFGDDWKKSISETKDFWVEMLERSKYAGVDYWKIDWGTWAYDANQRKTFSELAKQIYPELIVEHAICCWLVADRDSEIGRFENETASCPRAKALTEFSDVLRSYDVSLQLSMATTLDRIYNCLPNSKALMNCEDEHYMAAALGFAMGIMSPYNSDGGERAIATSRWHKIAPSFVGGEVKFSNTTYLDWYDFKPGDSWATFLDGRRIYQGAPSIFARDTELPLVSSDGEPPFVAASMNPSGAYSVATLKRTLGKNRSDIASVECVVGAAPKYIGIFGEFEKATFKLSSCPKKVNLICLITEEKADITSQIKLDKELVINKEIFEKYFNAKFATEPAFYLEIAY